MKFLITLLLTLTMLSCKKNDLTKGIGEEITLCFGDKGIISELENQLEIEFINLVEDSRCPEGSQCIWAGRAVIELRINSIAEVKIGIGDLQSATNAPILNIVEFDKYRIALLVVSYDKKRHRGKEEKYFVGLRVDRK
jgi:hypothetical protein